MTLKLQDLVQRIEYDHSIKDGKLLEIIPASKSSKCSNYWSLSSEEQKEYQQHAIVEWLDGTRETLSIEELSPRDNQLEREFRNQAWQIEDRIKDQLEKAREALETAVAISEQYGIPFASNISLISQSYVPTTFGSKYNELDKKLVETITDVYDTYDKGWTDVYDTYYSYI